MVAEPGFQDSRRDGGGPGERTNREWSRGLIYIRRGGTRLGHIRLSNSTVVWVAGGRTGLD